MARSNRTRVALLGFLSWGPLSGYDIRKLVEGSISNFWSESYGGIYPMLAQLAREGLATVERTASDGGRPRNVYSITAEGRAMLDEWLSEGTATTQPPRDERLLKLFFGARTDSQSSIDLLESFVAELEEKQVRYAETRERLEAAKDAPADQRYWLMTLRYGEMKREAELAWCSEVLAELRSDG